MKTYKIWNNSTSGKQLEEIAERFKEGEVGIIPTDTMYGIAGDALNAKTVERICKIKRIDPSKTNLSILCADISMAAEYARIENKAFRLLKENTPGPFTWLFKTVSSLPKAFKGRKIVGIRIPDNEFCLDLLRYTGRPLITTSIEYEDDDYAQNPGLIAERYEGIVDFMVEGEDGEIAVSTIVDCLDSEFEILREGKGVLG